MPAAIRSGYRVMETVTPADVVELPATSVATAVSVCCRTAALRTRQDTEYVDVPVAGAVAVPSVVVPS